MNRDGRGNPGRYVPKNQPKLRLADVLRRRKTTLQALVSELGLVTYSGLEIWCRRMGVLPPSQEEFDTLVAAGPIALVNSPQEGVVVLDPVDDQEIGTPEGTQKKRRHKKGDAPTLD